MAIFRYKRNSFQESIKTKIEVKDLQELIDVLKRDNVLKGSEVLEEHVEINNYGYDARLKEEVFFVRVYNTKTKTAGVVGFIDTVL